MHNVLQVMKSHFKICTILLDRIDSSSFQMFVCLSLCANNYIVRVGVSSWYVKQEKEFDLIAETFTTTSRHENETVFIKKSSLTSLILKLPETFVAKNYHICHLNLVHSTKSLIT